MSTDYEIVDAPAFVQRKRKPKNPIWEYKDDPIRYTRYLLAMHRLHKANTEDYDEYDDPYLHLVTPSMMDEYDKDRSKRHGNL
jgi:hypothetical protein